MCRSHLQGGQIVGHRKEGSQDHRGIPSCVLLGVRCATAEPEVEVVGVVGGSDKKEEEEGHMGSANVLGLIRLHVGESYERNRPSWDGRTDGGMARGMTVF